jgi:hypothetical protein
MIKNKFIKIFNSSALAMEMIVDGMLMNLEALVVVNVNVNVDEVPFVTYSYPLHSSDVNAVSAVIVPIWVSHPIDLRGLNVSWKCY